MTPEQEAAYVISQSVCALVEALGMMSENMQRVHRNESLIYVDIAFFDLITRYGIHPNAVLEVMRP